MSRHLCATLMLQCSHTSSLSYFHIRKRYHFRDRKVLCLQHASQLHWIFWIWAQSRSYSSSQLIITAFFHLVTFLHSSLFLIWAAVKVVQEESNYGARAADLKGSTREPRPTLLIALTPCDPWEHGNISLATLIYGWSVQQSICILSCLLKSVLF